MMDIGESTKHERIIYNMRNEIRFPLSLMLTHRNHPMVYGLWIFKHFQPALCIVRFSMGGFSSAQNDIEIFYVYFVYSISENIQNYME